MSIKSSNNQADKATSILPKVAIFASIAIASLFNLPAYAEGGSVHHSGQASKHSVLAVAHGVGSTAKVASAVVATPIIAAGGVSLATGASAVSVGGTIATSANNASTVQVNQNQPLVVTDMVITADPAPNQAMQTTPNKPSKTTETTITTTKVKQTTIENKE